MNDASFLARDSPDCPHALIAYDSAHRATTPRIASCLATCLEHAGFIADTADAAAHAMPAPPDYELVVIGMTPNRLGDHALSRWVELYATRLAEMPSALFIVAPARRVAHVLGHRMRSLVWHPAATIVISPSVSLEIERSLAGFAARLADVVRGSPPSIELASAALR